MSSRAFVPACLWLLAVSGAALAEPKKQKLPPWAKFADEDGIALFRREVPGSDIVALRGEGLVDAPILRVGSVLIDSAHSTEWIDSLSESRIVRKISETEYVKWDHITTPFGIADRDFVFKVRIEFKAKEKQMIVSFHSVKDSAAPKTDHVRGELVYGSYVLTSVGGGRQTRVLAEVLCDPKGSVAKWMVNLFQKSWPYDTISNLRRQVKKAGFVDSTELSALLEQEGVTRVSPSRGR
jgi:hypothetical protein